MSYNLDNKVTYKPTEENLQRLLEGKIIKEVLFLRDKPDSPYGSGFNLYIKTAEGSSLVVETEYAELTLTKATNVTKEV